MSIGTITVDLLAKTGSFETDMDRASKVAKKRAQEIDDAVSKAASKVGTVLGAGAAAAAAGVVYMTRSIIDGLDALNDVKDATGSSIENISALEDVALRTGTTLESVSGIMVKFNGVLKEADGKNGVSQALKAIGLDAEELKKIDPAEALRQTAVALSGFADDGNKARLVQELFGKSIKEAAPFLNDLAEKTKLVGTVSSDAASNAEAFKKQIAEIEKNSLDAKRALLEGLLPALNLFLKNARDIKAMGGFDLIIKDAAKDMLGLGKMTGDNGADINQFMRERERLQKNLNFANSKGLPTRDIEGDLKENARYLALLRLKQSNEVAAASMGQDYSDAVSRKTDGTKPTVGDIGKPPKAGKKDNSAAQEAKAQLAQDLEDMKKNTALLAGAFDNDEKILQALRSASLISDAEYYAKKRDIIIATGEVEDAGLQASIDRLKREQATLTGKDAIDNQRKLNDAEAELRKSRAATATQLTTNNIEATASTKKLATAMEDARAAAESMLDATNRARALELAGMGQGTKQRDYSASVSQIEQTYEQKRQDLERDRRNGKFKDREEDYKRELDLINEFQKKAIDSYVSSYALIEEKQRDFLLGASEGAKNYADEAVNAYKQTEDAVKNMFGGLEDALTSFVTTGKADVKSLVNSIISDFARITIRQQITGPLAKMVSDALNKGGDPLDGLLSSNNAFGTGGGGGGGSGWLGEMFSGIGKFFGGFFADGGSPPIGKVSVVGERGPELFVPNTAGRIVPNHELGRMDGGGTTNNYFTVGDVATVGMLKQALASTEARMAGGLRRSQRYGGEAAA